MSRSPPAAARRGFPSPLIKDRHEVMFPDSVSHTALLTAAARARESLRPHPLFNDPYAGAIAGAEGERLLAEVDAETATPSIAIRTRFYDDVLRDAVLRGLGQVVLLGAGLDTRAYRMGLSNLQWFEVDREPVLAYKRKRLADAGQSPTVKLHDVAADVSDPELLARLDARGLDRRRPVLWIAEGLFAFLAQAEIDGLLGRLAQGSCAGSEVLFDVPNVACVQAQGDFARAAAALSKRGFQFGTDAPAALSEANGFTTTVVHDGHPRAHYGRRVEPPIEEIPPGKWTVYFVHGQLISRLVGS